MDPKGYHACLVSSPGRTPTKFGRRITAARGSTIQTTTRALRRKPAFRPSTKPTGRLAIQPHGPPTTGREWAAQRPDGPTLAPFAGGGPSSSRFARTRSKKLARFIGGGALGLTLLALLFEVAVGPHGSELLSSTPPPASSASATHWPAHCQSGSQPLQSASRRRLQVRLPASRRVRLGRPQLRTNPSRGHGCFVIPEPEARAEPPGRRGGGSPPGAADCARVSPRPGRRCLGASLPRSA